MIPRINNSSASPTEAAGVAAAATCDAGEGGPVTLLPKARDVAKAGHKVHRFAREGGRNHELRGGAAMNRWCILLPGSTL